MIETGKWYEKSGNCGDVVCSTRVRLARNLKQFPFPGKGHRSTAGSRGAEGAGCPPFWKQHFVQGVPFCTLENASEEEAVSLVERHIVSPEFISDRRGKAVLISDDESISILINEEDHLRSRCCEKAFL